MEEPVVLNSESINTIPTARSNVLPFFMWLIAVIFVLYQFLLQLSTGVMIKQLMQTFSLTALGVGILGSSYYFVYVLLQAPAGMLVDRFGARKLLTAGGLICAVGCWLFAISQGLFIACLGRVFIGIGASCAFVSTLYIAGNWFSKSLLGIFAGLAETFGMLGGIIGNLSLAVALQDVSWRSAIMVAAVIAIAISFFSWVVIRDQSSETATVDDTTSFKEFFMDIKKLIKLPGLWLNGIYGGLVFSVVTVFVAVWAIPYFVIEEHITIEAATVISSMALLGLAIGSPIIGWLYSRTNYIKVIMSMSSFLAAILLVWLIYVPPTNLILFAAIQFIIGLLCASYVCNYAIAYEIAPKSAKSTSVGFTNMLCVITAPIIVPIIGWLLNLDAIRRTGTHQLIYTIHDYHFALIIMPLLLIMAGILVMFIPTVNCNQPKPNSVNTNL